MPQETKAASSSIVTTRTIKVICIEAHSATNNNGNADQDAWWIDQILELQRLNHKHTNHQRRRLGIFDRASYDIRP
jgi:hypothetical protein